MSGRVVERALAKFIQYRKKMTKNTDLYDIDTLRVAEIFSTFADLTTNTK